MHLVHVSSNILNKTHHPELTQSVTVCLLFLTIATPYCTFGPKSCIIHVVTCEALSSGPWSFSAGSNPGACSHPGTNSYLGACSSYPGRRPSYVTCGALARCRRVSLVSLSRGPPCTNICCLSFFSFI